jgi:hypothetical protein
MKNDDRVVTGFMCKVDWDHELGAALGGNTVFASEADLIANKKCTDECGIVEVEVRLKRVIRESDFSIKPDKTYRVVSFDKEAGKRVVKTLTGKELLERRSEKT